MTRWDPGAPGPPGRRKRGAWRDALGHVDEVMGDAWPAGRAHELLALRFIGGYRVDVYPPLWTY